MAINARALGIVQQTDTQIVQTVRLFQGVTPVRDVQVAYAPGADQATAQANLQAVVKAMLAKFASDASTVACAPGTILDLSDPVPTPPTQDQIDQGNYFTARSKAARIKQMLDLGSSHVTSQDLASAVNAWNALTYNPAWEGLA
jgi:hypothetical protein